MSNTTLQLTRRSGLRPCEKNKGYSFRLVFGGPESAEAAKHILSREHWNAKVCGPGDCYLDVYDVATEDYAKALADNCERRFACKCVLAEEEVYKDQLRMQCGPRLNTWAGWAHQLKQRGVKASGTGLKATYLAFLATGRAETFKDVVNHVIKRANPLPPIQGGARYEH